MLSLWFPQAWYMLICLFPHCSSKSGRKAPYALTSLEVEVTGELEREKLLACMLTSAPYCETRTRKCEPFAEFPKLRSELSRPRPTTAPIGRSLSGQRVKQLPGARLSRPEIPQLFPISSQLLTSFELRIVRALIRLLVVLPLQLPVKYVEEI
jgi:hypothetical protein